MSKAADLARTASASETALSNRNVVINGDYTISQRGTSFSSQTGVAYHLDRWEMYGYNMGDGVYRVDQSTDAPAGFSNSNKVSCTTADASQDANNQMFFQQMIEGLNSSHINYFVSSPDTVTLSFWVKSNRTGSYSLGLKLSNNGSVQNNTATRIYNSTYSVSVANTWEKKTITIVMDTSSSTKVVTNGFAMALIFWLGGGTNRDESTANSWINNGNAATASDNLDILGSTSNDWYITGVQLEVGTVATPFEHRSYGQELALCQRYYYNYISGNLKSVFAATAILANYISGVITFPVTMRAAPSAVIASGSDYYREYSSGASGFSDFTGERLDVNSATLSKNGGGPSIAAGDSAIVYTNNASASISFDAEL